MNSLESLSVTGLETLLSKYPWFSLARKELYLRTAVMGEEYRKIGMKRAGLYVPSGEQLIKDGKRVSDPDTIINIKEERKNEARDRQTIRVIGGDWFSQEDIDSVMDNDFSDNISSHPIYEPVETVPAVTISEESFYTETLARVYSEQELYQMAIEIYEKLILIYPEKSAYFAALIEEQQKHLKEL